LLLAAEVEEGRRGTIIQECGTPLEAAEAAELLKIDSTAYHQDPILQ
jgi:hypothetical protein